MQASNSWRASVSHSLRQEPGRPHSSFLTSPHLPRQRTGPLIRLWNDGGELSCSGRSVQVAFATVTMDGSARCQYWRTTTPEMAHYCSRACLTPCSEEYGYVYLRITKLELEVRCRAIATCQLDRYIALQGL